MLFALPHNLELYVELYVNIVHTLKQPGSSSRTPDHAFIAFRLCSVVCKDASYNGHDLMFIHAYIVYMI